MFPGTYGHQKSVRTYMRSGRVPGHILSSDGFLCTYWHQNGIRVRMGTLFRCSYVHGHHSDAHTCAAPFCCQSRNPSGAIMCPGTIPLPTFARAPFQCPYVPAHHSGAHMCLGTIPVSRCSGHPPNAYMCPCTIKGSACALAPFRFPYMPWYPYGVHMSPGTFPVPKCVRVSFRCSCVPRLFSGAHMCPGTTPVPICVWAHFRCSHVLGYP